MESVNKKIKNCVSEGIVCVKWGMGIFWKSALVKFAQNESALTKEWV